MNFRVKYWIRLYFFRVKHFYFRLEIAGELGISHDMLSPKPENTSQSAMPDISVETRAELVTTLSRVGMRGIEVPLQIRVAGEDFRLPARVDAFVSLDDPAAKGIHMSRLYLQVQAAFEKSAFEMQNLGELLDLFLETHKGLSQESSVRLEFTLPVKRKALKSGEWGWRHYPVQLLVTRTREELSYQLRFEVMYSSTCPCSAALSRQLTQQQFQHTFKDDQPVGHEDVLQWLGTEASAAGVAHAQRSRAQVLLKLKQPKQDILWFIDQVEQVLGTPVQAAVKRVDEQEFARLNAENLMFCEDAGRKIKVLLENLNTVVADYLVEVSHEESLHPHNAVSVAVKGLPGGYSASRFQI